MARKTILDTYYTFTPSSRTLIINRAIPRERLVLITNVTSNLVVYNFSDANLSATNYTITTDSTGVNTYTTITLNYNTTGMNISDRLQIVIDEYDEKFTPSDTLLDPVGKFRTSTPQALIDTDFEYSPQSTKWETLALINNRPFAYYNPYVSIAWTTINATNGSRTVTVSTSSPPSLGSPIYMLDTLWAGADGLYIIDAVVAGTSFSYTSKIQYTGTTGDITNTGVTVIYGGYRFTGSVIPLNTVTYSGTSNLITVSTTTPHGLSLGNEVALTGLAATTNAPNGSWTVSTVTSPTAFSFYAVNIPTGTSSTSLSLTIVTTAGSVTATCSATANAVVGQLITGTGIPSNTYIAAITTNTNITLSNPVISSQSISATVAPCLFVRPMGQVNHRAFDGGVQFSTNAQSHNQQLIRQTRRYFRYQSGKGIQMSTGTILKPNINIDQISSSGSIVTVVTKLQHNLNINVGIIVSGANETAYNGNFVISGVKDPYTFTYSTANGVTPTASPASGNYVLSITNWYGGSTRVGLFDSQNGVFFEHDGQSLYAVKRSSTYQISGMVSVTLGSSTVTGQTTNGVSTIFSKQLQPNDFIVIKGSSYRVINITSDTSMTISPAFRGSQNLVNGIVSKTIDLRISQSLWNIDRCDGTGPSGFIQDLSKMQMFYVDYSWYGAGFVRWGFRAADGNIIYCHRMVNNNINYEAYMRSGNLPGRYESNTFSKTSLLTSSMGTTDTIINISDTYGWPISGTAVIRNGTAQEYINYTSISQVSSQSFTLTYGNTTITGANTTGILAGQYVSALGIPTGTYVISVATNASVTLSQSPTVSGIRTINFAPTLTGITRAQAGGTLTFTTTLTSGVVIGASTTGIQIGQYVTGTGIPPNTYVISFITNTSVTLSQYPTVAGSQSLTFAPMGATSAQSWTYVATAPIAVELHSPAFATTISHWGTSVIMDGRFDDDKSYVFTKGMSTTVAIAAAANNALMSIRIGPSVSNGITGSTLAIREIVNRMQLVLRQMDVFSNGNFLITLVLNGTTSLTSDSWGSVGGSSLAQFIFHNAGTTVSGGENVFGFFLNSNGTNYGTTQQDLSLVRDLGTSILSGGVTAAGVQVYPDGPDVITVMASNIGGSSSNIFGRLSWTEAQA